MNLFFATIGITEWVQQIEALDDEAWLKCKLSEKAKAYSRVLFQMLAAGCSGKPIALLRLRTPGDGFGCWRAFIREYEPCSSARHLTMLSQILSPSWVPSRFGEGLLRWESDVAQYEAASGQTINDGMKTSIVARHAPPAVRDWIRTTESTAGGYASFRSALNSFLARSRSYELGGSASASASSSALPAVDESVDMDVGAIGKGVGKGKQQGGKIQRRLQQQQRQGRDFDIEMKGTFSGICNRCGKKGHRKAQCVVPAHKCHPPVLPQAQQQGPRGPPQS
jgi:hypothetical protein